MAKAKARRAKGRRAGSPRRAASPAKSRKSKKSLKTRAKTARKARRRPAPKAAARRRLGRSSASTRAKGKRPQKAARPATAKKARKVVRPARKGVKAVAKKPVARKPAVTRRIARKATAVPTPKATGLRQRPAPSATRATVQPARKSPPPTHGKLPALDRERRRLPEADVVPSPPSSLNLNRTPSAARSGQAEIAEHLADHTETGPEITGGDVDASWESAYSTGDEAPGGDNPTPDQDVVDEIGRSLGLVYEDTEELKGADKITERDKHRWELDPASAEDFEER